MRFARCLIALTMIPAALFIITGCEQDPSPFPSGPTGWQKTADMYVVDDYTWVDLSSAAQLTGIWRGSKLIEKPAVTGVNPDYTLLVQLQMIHTDAGSTLYVIEENQFFTEATSGGANWETMKSSLAGTPTGNRINTLYPQIAATDSNFFYGSAASTPGVRFERDYWVQFPGMYPSFVETLSVKISEDNTKLLLQYSDEIQFVIGKQS